MGHPVVMGRERGGPERLGSLKLLRLPLDNALTVTWGPNNIRLHHHLEVLLLVIEAILRTLKRARIVTHAC